MAIDKKLNMIKEAVIAEAKHNEEQINNSIKQYIQKIEKNSNFLSNLDIVKRRFKTSEIKDNTAEVLKCFLKGGELINQFRLLDLSEKPDHKGYDNLFETE